MGCGSAQTPRPRGHLAGRCRSNESIERGWRDGSLSTKFPAGSDWRVTMLSAVSNGCWLASLLVKCHFDQWPDGDADGSLVGIGSSHVRRRPSHV